jgi:hypothetical protein
MSIAERRRQIGNDQRAILHDVALAAGISARPDPKSRFHAMIPPNGFGGVLANGSRPNGDPGLIYVVSLRRDHVLAPFALADIGATDPAGPSPADRTALAQGLAAVRLSILLPSAGFLTTAASPSD